MFCTAVLEVILPPTRVVSPGLSQHRRYKERRTVSYRKKLIILHLDYEYVLGAVRIIVRGIEYPRTGFFLPVLRVPRRLYYKFCL